MSTQRKSRSPLVAAVIPAYNEEGRIVGVIDAAKGALLVDEIVVVSDGSTDSTARVAREHGVTVIELFENVGKGGAMAEGVAATVADVLLFVDGDLEGLEPSHLDDIIRPVLSGECDMCVGVIRGGSVWSDTGQLISPTLSGQRSLRRALFESVEDIQELRLGIEVALNEAARQNGSIVQRVTLEGVSNCLKEQKMGLFQGTAARAKMYMEIGQAMVKSRKRALPVHDRQGL